MVEIKILGTSRKQFKKIQWVEFEEHIEECFDYGDGIVFRRPEESPLILWCFQQDCDELMLITEQACDIWNLRAFFDHFVKDKSGITLENFLPATISPKFDVQLD